MNIVMAANQAGAGDRISVLPMWTTFGILVVVVVELMVAGFLLKRKWLETHEALPVSAAAAMMFFMVSLYAFVGSLLYWSSAPAERPQILFWLFLLYVPLVIQYGVNLVNSIVWRITQRISPIGVAIPDSPVLNQAHKLLMSGKTEAAIALYTSYYERRTPALAEVARLLKAEEKVPEATAIFVELVEHHASDRVAWPEAVYSLAKIYETQPEKAPVAMQLYRRLLDKAPESRFTLLAGADLARLMIMDASFIKTLKEDDETTVPEDPFLAQRRNFLVQRMQQQEYTSQGEEGGVDKKTMRTSAAKKKASAKAGSAEKRSSVGAKKSAAKKETAPTTPAGKTRARKKQDAGEPGKKQE